MRGGKRGRRIVHAGLASVVGTLVLCGWAAAVIGPQRAERGVRQVLAPVTRSWRMLRQEYVDAGGFRLHIVCQGTGQPTVVLESGLAQTAETWGGIPGQVARFTRVCSYTRAGLGTGAEHSDPSPHPRTSEAMVDELHTLLRNAGVPGPYVLMGHSFGGFNSQLFAYHYPHEVDGLVLVDAQHEDQLDRFGALLPDGARAAYEQSTRDNGEGVDLAASAAQVRRAAPLAVPAVVLSAPFDGSDWDGPVDQLASAWEEMQSDLATRLPGSMHVLAAGSGHFIQHDRPELVVAAIRTVVYAARLGRLAAGS